MGVTVRLRAQARCFLCGEFLTADEPGNGGANHHGNGTLRSKLRDGAWSHLCKVHGYDFPGPRQRSVLADAIVRDLRLVAP